MLPKPHTFPASETIAENYRKISQTFYTSVQNVPSDFLKLDLDRGQREGGKAQGEQIKAKDIEKNPQNLQQSRPAASKVDTKGTITSATGVFLALRPTSAAASKMARAC